MPREGILIDKPLERLTSEQVRQIHDASMEILQDRYPDLLSYNRKASQIFKDAGAEVTEISGFGKPVLAYQIPQDTVYDALEKATEDCPAWRTYTR
jgi:trimethylamine:corrinoid methyltransferase-like protein